VPVTAAAAALFAAQKDDTRSSAAAVVVGRAEGVVLVPAVAGPFVVLAVDALSPLSDVHPVKAATRPTVTRSTLPR